MQRAELENFSVLADDFFTEYLVRNNIDVNQELKKVLEKRAIFSRSLRNPLRSFAIQYSCNAKNAKGYAKLRKVTQSFQISTLDSHYR